MISAAAGVIGAFAIIHRTRTDAQVAHDAGIRQDHVDVVEHLTAELAASRAREAAEREKAERWQAEYYRLLVTTQQGVATLQAVADEQARKP